MICHLMKTATCSEGSRFRQATTGVAEKIFQIKAGRHFCACQLSLSRNPVCTQEQTGSRTYTSEKTAKRNEDNRFLHFHVANFFKFMAANLSFTQFVT